LAQLAEGAVAPVRYEGGALATREALLGAAREVLSTKGIVEATVDDVVRIAGVARGTFYNYFKDKYDLLFVLYSELTEKLYSDSDVEPVADLTTFERIMLPIRAVFEHYREDMGVLRAVEQVSTSRPEFAEIANRYRAIYVDRIRRDLDASINRYRARPIDTRVAAAAINAMVGRMGTEWFSLGITPYEGASLDDVVHEMSLFIYRATFARDPKGWTPPSTAR
jgi:AcrR family transcriptional regulator